MVRLVQYHTGKRAAAIGDGGNDVSMIQAASSGIGIVGKEGMQGGNSSVELIGFESGFGHDVINGCIQMWLTAVCCGAVALHISSMGDANAAI